MKSMFDTPHPTHNYSAQATPEHVRVRRSIASHVQPTPGYAAFLAELAERPEQHHLLKPGLRFDPEVVFVIDYLSDEAGWAHTLQVHPDGGADYIAHQPSQLDKASAGSATHPIKRRSGWSYRRQLSRKATPQKRLKTVPPGDTWRCEIELGALTPEAAQELAAKIAKMLGS